MRTTGASGGKAIWAGGAAVLQNCCCATRVGSGVGTVVAVAAGAGTWVSRDVGASVAVGVGGTGVGARVGGTGVAGTGVARRGVGGANVGKTAAGPTVGAGAATDSSHPASSTTHTPTAAKRNTNENCAGNPHRALVQTC